MLRKKLLILLIISMFASLFLLTAQQRGLKVVIRTGAGQSLELYGEYRALLIGVSDYLYWPKLPNAVRDAREIDSALKSLGFATILLENPNSSDVKKALNDLVFQQSGPEDGILLYFAGHGETMKLADGTELGYIVPRDCPLRASDLSGFADKAISMEAIQTYSLQLKSKHLLAVFDSCFSGSIFALGRAAPADISFKTASPVRQYITAGGAEEIVPDESIFKRCFLDALKGEADANRDGYVTGSELGLYLESNVVNYSRNAQHPQYGRIRNPNLDKGDFVFVLEKASAGGPTDSQAPPRPPEKTGLDLEKLKKTAEERANAEAEWATWQAKMRSDFNEMEKLEKDPNLTSDEKKNGWQSYLNTYSGDNPFSSEDEGLRQKADQKLKMLAEPKPLIQVRVTLRSSPRSLSVEEIKDMLKKDMLKRDRFFDSSLNESGDFANDYEGRTVNGDKVVIDHATGLIWHQSGSKNYMNHEAAKRWVDELNRTGYAGYKDWRIPTLEEVASLIENKKMNGDLYIDPKFSAEQIWIWTSDLYGSGWAWVVCFLNGDVTMGSVGDYYVRPVRSGQ